MDPSEIRKTAIIAMFSDDVLMQRLVLKGGNALDLVHQLTGRGSLDIDFSIPSDFEDIENTKERIFTALRDRFDSAGLTVFDERFMAKPSELREGQDERWGGYRVEFKVIPKETANRLGNVLDQMRINATVVGLGQQRVFRIEISKHEYCEEKVEADLDAYTIYVYTPAMIAAEKLRALCQQMPEYAAVKAKRARARDFYDIHTIVTRAGLEMGTEDFRELVKAVFAAKDVPLTLLSRISQYRDFHSPDWPAVLLALAVGEKSEEFDFYFDFIVAEVKKLEVLWNV